MNTRIAAFCALLALLNWHSLTTYERTTSGLVRSEQAPVALALTLAVGLTAWLFWKTWSVVREVLSHGVQVRPARWVESRWAFLGLLPLLAHVEWRSSWIEPDDAVAQKVVSYGHSLSVWVLVFGAAAIVLLQVRARLAEALREAVLRGG